MLSNYWENKREEKENIEELQKIYKDEVMKYKLSKVAGEHYYSTLFKPVTEKLEEVFEPLKETRLEAPPTPAAIEAPPLAPVDPITPGVTITEVEDEDEDDYYDTYKAPLFTYNPDEGMDIEILKKYDLKPPSGYMDLSSKQLKDVNYKIGTTKSYLTKNIKKYKEIYEKVEKTPKVKQRIEDYEKEYEQLDLLTDRLKTIKEVKRGKGFMQYIDLPLLKKQKILQLKDKLGNIILNRKVNKDFVDLITKRFNSKKKYKGSSIESFRLLNELSPISKRNKKVSLCTSKPIFYDKPRELIDHLDLILGSIEAGNNNLKNEGIAVIDELLKNGILNQKSHEIIYKRFFN